MLGVEGERMMIALLGLVSFSVLVQIFTVEYLDLRNRYDNRRLNNIRGIMINLPTENSDQENGVRREEGHKGETQQLDIGIDIDIDIDKDSNVQAKNNRQAQQSRVLTNVTLRDIEIILTAAHTEISPEERAKMPPKSDITEMYGSHPVILGLERCEEFRRNVSPEDAFLGPAGMVSLFVCGDGES